MRQASVIGLMGLAIVLCAARPASAQWAIIKWLEELSGPGKVMVQRIDLAHFGCRWKDQPRGKDATAFNASVARTNSLERALVCDSNPFQRGGVGYYADKPLWKSVESFFTVNLTAPWFTGTGTNPLEYPEGEARENLRFWSLTGGWTYRPSEYADLSVAAGPAWLSSSTTKTTTKFVTDFGVLIRPLVKMGRRWDQTVGVLLSAQWFPEGFTLQDFGATAGSLDGRSEFITQVGVTINIYNLVRHR